MNTDVDTRRRAACDLVKALARLFEGPVIQNFTRYVQTLLAVSSYRIIAHFIILFYHTHFISDIVSCDTASWKSLISCESLKKFSSGYWKIIVFFLYVFFCFRVSSCILHVSDVLHKILLVILTEISVNRYSFRL